MPRGTSLVFPSNKAQAATMGSLRSFYEKNYFFVSFLGVAFTLMEAKPLTMFSSLFLAAS